MASALKFGASLRSGIVNAIESVVGTTPILQVRTGAPPANPAAAAAGTLLVSIALPSDWMAAASGGAAAKTGTWAGVAVDSGDPGHFRLLNTAGSTCHAQGTASGPSGDVDDDLKLSADSLASGQSFSVETFTLTAGNQ